MYLIRQPSMLVNATLYAKILRLLRKCLRIRNIQHRRRVVIMADAFGGHITFHAMKAITKYEFYVVLLSAGLTWLLQPLDVQTFVCVKKVLARSIRTGAAAGCRTSFDCQHAS